MGLAAFQWGKMKRVHPEPMIASASTYRNIVTFTVYVIAAVPFASQFACQNAPYLLRPLCRRAPRFMKFAVTVLERGRFPPVFAAGRSNFRQSCVINLAQMLQPSTRLNDPSQYAGRA